MKNKIVVIGSSNIDLIMKMDRLPSKGETVGDAEFLQVYGGKGANQAVGAARAGGNVAFISCVGDDAYTPQMLQNYKDDGIDTSYVFQEKGLSSGHALIMIGDAGNNYISVAPGANYALNREKIDEAMPIIDQAAMIILQFEILADTIKYILDIAHEKQIPIMWNFAPAREFDMEYIAKTNILAVNEVEAELLTGVKIIDHESAGTVARVLIENGTEIVILTLGSKGAYAFSNAKKHFVPAFVVDAVDTTAAGDVFCGSFAVARIEGKSLKESLKFANAAAAMCVTRIGAQPSAPGREQIEDFLSKN